MIMSNLYWVNLKMLSFKLSNLRRFHWVQFFWNYFIFGSSHFLLCWEVSEIVVHGTFSNFKCPFELQTSRHGITHGTVDVSTHSSEDPTFYIIWATWKNKWRHLHSESNKEKKDHRIKFPPDLNCNYFKQKSQFVFRTTDVSSYKRINPNN